MIRILLTVVLLVSCSAPQPPVVSAPPAYQLRWGGLSVRDRDQLVEASAADAAVVQGYASWRDKGNEIDHTRVTVMTSKSDYAVGESIHVVHVFDLSVPGRSAFIMGPKPAVSEYLDDKLATTAPQAPHYPWVGEYDGATLLSPAIDYNFDITSYRFDAPGTHTIQWRPGNLVSNTLTIHVR